VVSSDRTQTKENPLGMTKWVPLRTRGSGKETSLQGFEELRNAPN
jgi:hypothetical protein